MDPCRPGNRTADGCPRRDGPEHRSCRVASATINVSQQIGASIGTTLLNSIAAGAAASFITAHAAGTAPPQVLVAQAAAHSYTVAFWAGAAIMTAAALAVAPLLRPGLAELGVMPRSDIGPRGVTTDRHTQPVRSVLACPPSGPGQHLDPRRHASHQDRPTTDP